LFLRTREFKLDKLVVVVVVAVLRERGREGERERGREVERRRLST